MHATASFKNRSFLLNTVSCYYKHICIALGFFSRPIFFVFNLYLGSFNWLVGFCTASGQQHKTALQFFFWFDLFCSAVRVSSRLVSSITVPVSNLLHSGWFQFIWTVPSTKWNQKRKKRTFSTRINMYHLLTLLSILFAVISLTSAAKYRK